MYGSREHLNELNVRPLPQALPTHDVVAESHIMRERLEIPSLLVYMRQRKKRHMGESKENVNHVWSRVLYFRRYTRTHTVMNVGMKTGDRCETFKDRAQTRYEIL